MRKTWTYLSLCKQAVQCQHHYHPVKIQIVTQYWTKWRTSLKNPKEKWICTIFASKVWLMTCFHEFRIHQYFSRKMSCMIFKGPSKCLFFVKIDIYRNIFISMEKFFLVLKENWKNMVIKICGFVIKNSWKHVMNMLKAWKLCKNYLTGIWKQIKADDIILTEIWWVFFFSYL